MSRTTGLSRRLAVPYHRLAGNRGLTAELEASHGAAAKFLDPILRGRITAGELGPGCRSLAVGRRHGQGRCWGPLPVLASAIQRASEVRWRLREDIPSVPGAVAGPFRRGTDSSDTKSGTMRGYRQKRARIKLLSRPTSGDTTHNRVVGGSNPPAATNLVPCGTHRLS